MARCRSDGGTGSKERKAKGQRATIETERLIDDSRGGRWHEILQFRKISHASGMRLLSRVIIYMYIYKTRKIIGFFYRNISLKWRERNMDIRGVIFVNHKTIRLMFDSFSAIFFYYIFLYIENICAIE